MNILGLNFGHDASACVVRDGRVVSYVLRERHSRRKHAIGLTTKEVERCLAEAGITESQIDLCAITSTQCVELVTGLIDGFDIELTVHPRDPINSPLQEMIKRQGVDIREQLSFDLRRAIRGELAGQLIADGYKMMFAEWSALANGELSSVGWLDKYLWQDSWQPAGLSLLGERKIQLGDQLRLGFHYPVTVALRGHRIPAYFVFHHMAHAASSFYQSRFDHAAILTHDGFGNGVGYQSGLFAFGMGSKIWALTPHHLVNGSVYDRVAVQLGFDLVGGAGKLMGLSSYGRPRFFRGAFVGNEYDARARWGEPLSRAWVKHCQELAARAGYDVARIGIKGAVTEPVNADIAASTQKLFEETTLRAAEVLRALIDGMNVVTPNLCLSGGTALNCPSNSRIARESPFPSIFIEPNCDDGGLSVGAALFVHHNLLDQPVLPSPKPMSPYLGGAYDQKATMSAAATFGNAVRTQVVSNAPAAAAAELAQDRVIGWFEGRSEIGPRALGHRSILAEATRPENWARVNRIKGREAWRPFAPAVLEADAAEWFRGCPAQSPYMLFTAQVASQQLPAITHVDGSARIQTVGPDAGGFYELLRAYKAATGIPAILNTSFNGPGDPIVEAPAEAIGFLMGSELDAIYLDGVRIERAR